MSFKSLGLSVELNKAIEDKGYTKPSDIQMQAIPSILSGNDIMGGAQTGTGKTAAFALPILQRLQNDESKRTQLFSTLYLILVRVGPLLRNREGSLPPLQQEGD